MATSSSSLVVMLVLLSSVVASQAHQVSCKNRCKKAMSFNGISIGKGMTTSVKEAKEIKCEVYDLKGVKHVVNYKCPENVIGLEFLCEGRFVKAKITEMSDLGSMGDSAVNTQGFSADFPIPSAGRRLLRGPLPYDPKGLHDPEALLHPEAPKPVASLPGFHNHHHTNPEFPSLHDPQALFHP